MIIKKFFNYSHLVKINKYEVIHNIEEFEKDEISLRSFARNFPKDN